MISTKAPIRQESLIVILAIKSLTHTKHFEAIELVQEDQGFSLLQQFRTIRTAATTTALTNGLYGNIIICFFVPTKRNAGCLVCCHMDNVAALQSNFVQQWAYECSEGDWDYEIKILVVALCKMLNIQVFCLSIVHLFGLCSESVF